jgi:DNA mismatch repair protein MSH5
MDSPMQLCSSSCNADDQFRLPYLLEVRPAAEFNYEAAKIKLVNLQLGQDDGPQVTFVIPGDVLAVEGFDDDENFAGRQGQLLRLAGWIDLESRFTVSFYESQIFIY